MEKFILSEEEPQLEERFTSGFSKKDHFYRHGTLKGPSKQAEAAYEKMADELALSPVDYKNIFGYTVAEERVERTGAYGPRFAKYDKQKEFYVVYGGINQDGEPIVISAYPLSWRDYQSKQAVNYGGEIPVPEFQKFWDFRHNQKYELPEN
jgi:hypothetical protein